MNPGPLAALLLNPEGILVAIKWPKKRMKLQERDQDFTQYLVARAEC